jgi:hypothetical protein
MSSVHLRTLSSVTKAGSKGIAGTRAAYASRLRIMLALQSAQTA